MDRVLPAGPALSGCGLCHSVCVLQSVLRRTGRPRQSAYVAWGDADRMPQMLSERVVPRLHSCSGKILLADAWQFWQTCTIGYKSCRAECHSGIVKVSSLGLLQGLLLTHPGWSSARGHPLKCLLSTCAYYRPTSNNCPLVTQSQRLPSCVLMFRSVHLQGVL